MKRIPAGNVEFLVETRESGDDGGPSIQVLATVEGREVQLLRFDCFRKGPHYHYDPDGRNHHYDLDPLFIEDSLGWALTQLGERLGPLVERAGYPAVAQALDTPAVAAGLAQVEAHFRASSPSSS